MKSIFKKDDVVKVDILVASIGGEFGGVWNFTDIPEEGREKVIKDISVDGGILSYEEVTFEFSNPSWSTLQDLKRSSSSIVDSEVVLNIEEFHIKAFMALLKDWTLSDDEGKKIEVLRSLGTGRLTMETLGHIDSINVKIMKCVSVELSSKILN